MTPTEHERALNDHYGHPVTEGWKAIQVLAPHAALSLAMIALSREGVSTDDVASYYADCLRADSNRPGINWRKLNRAIEQRWPGKLESIKRRAWKRLEMGIP